MNMIYYIIAFAAGLGITLQTTLNSQLARSLGGDSVTAALFSFSTGAFSLGIYSLLRGGLFTSLAAIPSQPLWSLAGGLIGACALFSYVVLAPKIGFSALLGLAIVGQLLSSQMIDHFGLLSAVKRPVSLIKLGGMLVMLIGLVTMLFGDRLTERLFH
ncbi:DMT family transporter [Acinetobacter sp. AYS6]|uniref:DMT family transporter n=1 Tax=Gammaproteobacteria TaxID=1236 RepID=UPI0021CA33E8|nr:MULTISPECIES: DMT family transporter [Gammaproteobacteria]MCU0189120.1 DMT family transporter [Citrobacter freundii]MCU7696989.1 DMT family transporter [Acinetobacter sp. AYS6]